MWVELRRKSIFSRKLECSSDGFDASPYQFIWKPPWLYMKKGDQSLVSTDGDSYLRIGTTEFKFMKKYFFMLIGLYSDQDKYEIELKRRTDVPGRSFFKQIRRVNRDNEVYLIDTDRGWTTKVIVQAAPESTVCNPETLLALAAFEWMMVENSRD